jgi:uncharacterized protein YjaG (DUF416 family)
LEVPLTKKNSAILVNFSHPLNSAQLEQIATHLNISVVDIQMTTIRVEMDLQAPFSSQVEKLVEQVPAYLDYEVYALVNPPGLSSVSMLLTPLLLNIFEKFKMIRITTVPNSAMTSYSVAELIDIV